MWKQIENTGYKINEKGEIKGKRVNKIKTRLDRYGYEIVSLWHEGVCYTRKVHRLVAIAFLPNPENKPQVNHLNEVKDDNRIENLEWSTASENLNHSGNLYSEAFKEGRAAYHKSEKLKDRAKEMGNTHKFNNLKQYQSDED